MEVLAVIVGRVWDWCFDATCREFGHLYHYKDSIETLRKQAVDLEYKRERVQEKIKEATSKGDQKIFSDVSEWIERVETVTAQAEEFIEGEASKANKRCLKGLCIDPWSRYRVAKEAQSKIKTISILQREGEFETVSRWASPPRPEITASSYLSDNLEFRSRESVMDDIMHTLNDENVSLIGICGMGGVGKTTMVKEISRRAIQKKLYDRAAMAVVSQNQSYKNIQEEIAGMLGFTLLGNTESARARCLRQRIMEMEKQEPKPKFKKEMEKQEHKPKFKKEMEQQKEPELERILIILDDIWEGIELERIGIPFGNIRRGCKIVLTSRIEDVCIEMNAKTFRVVTLKREESWALFRDVAGKNVDDPDINPIAREVADECAGLPIAIVTVAGALKNRKNKYVWIDAKQQLQKSAPTNIRGMDQKVYASLELSYNFLGSQELQSVFLLCCLFPEDYRIPIEMLTRYGMGLRLFQEVDTVEEARARTHTVVSTLTTSFLLMSGNDDKHVKMHDVVRDVAIKLSKDKHMFMVKAGIRLREWPTADTFRDFTGISLMSNNIFRVPDGLEYPKLQVLLLQDNSSLSISDNFFQGMKDLKVLDMSRNGRLSLPKSLILLAKLTTLCLDNCKFGAAGISLIGKLTDLEILSLQNTDIADIPEDFGQLVKLRFFDLTACRFLVEKKIPHAVITCLKKLEELYVSNDKKGRHVIELQAFSQQTSLSICTQEAGPANSLGHAILSNHFPFQNHTSFSIKIGSNSYFPSFGFGSCSRILEIAGISYQPVDWSYQLPVKITEELKLHEIVGLRNILPNLGNHGFNDLKSLRLGNCKEITYLLNTLECTECIAFNNLESLNMENIPNMVEICHGPLPTESFCKLRRMQISLCHNMLNIVPSHLVKRLQSLEGLDAFNCKSVVYAFDFERLVIANAETKFLSSLKELQLVALPEMTRIWNGDAKLISLCNLKIISVYTCSKLGQVFPPTLLQCLVSLQQMEVSNCDSLEEIFGKEEEEEEDHQANEKVAPKIDQTTTSQSLGKLTTIQILFCQKLRNLFTPSIVKGLVQLRTLEVRRCIKMESIVPDEKSDTTASRARITFPSLYKISLRELDSLTCFCAGWCAIEFPALELVDIQDCPKMETFGRGDQVAPKLTMVYLQHGKHWKDNLNITVQQFFKEQEQHAAQ